MPQEKTVDPHDSMLSYYNSAETYELRTIDAYKRIRELIYQIRSKDVKVQNNKFVIPRVDKMLELMNTQEFMDSIRKEVKEQGIVYIKNTVDKLKLRNANAMMKKKDYLLKILRDEPR